MLAVLAALGSFCFLAGLSATADDKKEKESASSADRDFVMKATAASMAEMDFSNLALLRTRNAAVREFAQQMVADHRNALNALIEWANRHQVPVAKSKDEEHQKSFAKLSKLEGAEFERTYLEGMAKDHEEAVKLFETQSKEGKDEGLKSWAGKTLPTLKKHLEKARNLCEKEKGKSETRKGASDK
jgi:putative membrane protein